MKATNNIPRDMRRFETCKQDFSLIKFCIFFLKIHNKHF